MRVQLPSWAQRASRNQTTDRTPGPLLPGFSDATFSLMQTLEAGRDADWPF